MMGKKWMKMEAKTWVKDTGERVVSTIIQTFITLLVVSDGLDLTAKHAAMAAAIAAGMVVLKQAVNAQSAPMFGNRWADLLSRSGWTFLQTALTLLAVEGFDWGSMTAWQGVGVAGIAAALSVVKGFLASKAVPYAITPGSFVKPAEPLELAA